MFYGPSGQLITVNDNGQMVDASTGAIINNALTPGGTRGSGRNAPADPNGFYNATNPGFAPSGYQSGVTNGYATAGQSTASGGGSIDPNGNYVPNNTYQGPPTQATPDYSGASFQNSNQLGQQLFGNFAGYGTNGQTFPNYNLFPSTGFAGDTGGSSGGGLITPPYNGPDPNSPPPGSMRTNNPNVWLAPSGATWMTPGYNPQNDPKYQVNGQYNYDKFRMDTYGTGKNPTGAGMYANLGGAGAGPTNLGGPGISGYEGYTAKDWQDPTKTPPAAVLSLGNAALIKGNPWVDALLQANGFPPVNDTPPTDTTVPTNIPPNVLNQFKQLISANPSLLASLAQQFQLPGTSQLNNYSADTQAAIILNALTQQGWDLNKAYTAYQNGLNSQSTVTRGTPPPGSNTQTIGTNTNPNDAFAGSPLQNSINQIPTNWQLGKDGQFYDSNGFPTGRSSTGVPQVFTNTGPTYSGFTPTGPIGGEAGKSTPSYWSGNSAVNTWPSNSVPGSSTTPTNSNTNPSDFSTITTGRKPGLPTNGINTLYGPG